jgi:hypothetical protein
VQCTKGETTLKDFKVFILALLFLAGVIWADATLKGLWGTIFTNRFTLVVRQFSDQIRKGKGGERSRGDSGGDAVRC